MKRPVLLGMLLGVLLGCNKMSADECKREAAALQALLRSVDTEPAYLAFDDTMQLVSRADLPATELRTAPVLELRAIGTVFQGQRIKGRDELRARLAAAHDSVVDAVAAGHIAHSAPPDPAGIYLVIDARAPWPRVVEAWQAARDAELRAPAFVFVLAQTFTPPPRASIDSQLDGLGADASVPDKATRFAKLVEKEVAGCPAVMRSFGNVGMETGESKAQVLIRELGPALVDCRCNVNIPNLRSLLWRLLANPKPTRVVSFDPAAPARRIALPATATWADAAPQFTADLKNAELVVE